ncbi:hypothetical protein OKW28_002410 [Paraburkholderia sp. 40]
MQLTAIDTDDRLADEILDEYDVEALGQRADLRAGIGAEAGKCGKANSIETIHDLLSAAARPRIEQPVMTSETMQQ